MIRRETWSTGLSGVQVTEQNYFEDVTKNLRKEQFWSTREREGRVSLFTIHHTLPKSKGTIQSKPRFRVHHGRVIGKNATNLYDIARVWFWRLMQQPTKLQEKQLELQAEEQFRKYSYFGDVSNFQMPSGRRCKNELTFSCMDAARSHGKNVQAEGLTLC